MRSLSQQPTDRNTLIFKINHECTRNSKAPKGSTDPNELYFNSELKSSHIVWEPAGLQLEVFATKPAPTNKDIVLAKLRPGQQVNMELHAVKGVGKDHAKFSPVGEWCPFFFLSKLYFSYAYLSYCLLSSAPLYQNHQTDTPASCRKVSEMFLSWGHQNWPADERSNRRRGWITKRFGEQRGVEASRICRLGRIKSGQGFFLMWVIEYYDRPAL